MTRISPLAASTAALSAAALPAARRASTRTRPGMSAAAARRATVGVASAGSSAAPSQATITSTSSGGYRCSASVRSLSPMRAASRRAATTIETRGRHARRAIGFGATRARAQQRSG